MLFTVGDMFEVAGSKQYKVLLATEDYFICCKCTPEGENNLSGSYPAFIDIREVKTYSNKGNLESKYWVKRIDTYDGTYPRYQVEEL